MSYITTFSKTITGKFPYRFICNQCGQLCEKQLELKGIGDMSVRGFIEETPDNPALERKLTAAAMDDLRDKTAKILDDFEAYRSALNSPPRYKTEKRKAGPPRYLAMDGKCDHCGHEQFWTVDPDEAGLKPGCIVISLSAVGFIVGLIGITKTGTAEIILGITGLAILLGSVVGFFLVHTKSAKKEERRIAAMPHSGGLPVFGEVMLSDGK